MKRKFEYVRVEEFVPPRCRKPRCRDVQEKYEYEFREVAEEQAPVAFVQRNACPRLTALGQHYHHGDGKRIAYRLFAGQLWAPVRLSALLSLHGRQRNRQATTKDVYLTLSYADYRGTADEVRTRIKKGLDSRWLLVAGRLHEAVEEPLYVVYTLGLGCNHGGTGISVDECYNSNISRNRYFRIDQEAAAVKECERLALARGDTKNVPVKGYDKFDILMPQVLKRNPAKDHGDGDPFINDAERVIESMKNRNAAGIGVLALALMR